MVMDKKQSFVKLDPILNEVHVRKIRIDETEKAEAVKLCDQMLLIVRQKLESSDSILKHLVRGHTYRGSYYGGVKVGSADEFDIDIHLKLPLEYSQILIANSEPGYITINVKKAYNKMIKTMTWEKKYSDLIKFMDEKGYLLQTSLRAELESVLDRQFPQGDFKMCLNDQTLFIRKKKNGPAFTFEVKSDDLKIDIDFVFVILFENTLWPPKPVRKFNKLPPKSPNQYWFTVPKPTKENNPRSWRISFPYHESFLLNSENNLKFIYRLLKALRDAEKWKLASYHIATLFLHESNEMVDKNFWKTSIGTLFVHMLRKLLDCLDRKTITFFWHGHCNMISDLNDVTAVNMHNRLNEMLRQIDRRYDNQEELRRYVLVNMFRIDLNDS